MSYVRLVEEAKKLGIKYVGLRACDLEKRIQDKKNGTGIYVNSHIDPDIDTDELYDIADDMGIKTYYPSLTRGQIIAAINKKIDEGYKIGIRYNPSVKPSAIDDDSLTEYYRKLHESQINNPRDKEVYHQLEVCRGEFMKRGMPFPQLAQ